MSSSSNDIGYAKLIEMSIEINHNLPPIAPKPYTLPLKYQEWVRNELEDMEKAGITQRCLYPCVSLIVISNDNELYRSVPMVYRNQYHIVHC